VTCSHEQRMVRCSTVFGLAEIRKAREPKLNDGDEDNGLKEFGTIILIRQ